MKVYAVVFSNYEPAEVESLWETMEDAEARASALGSPWEAQEWDVQRRSAVGSAVGPDPEPAD